MMKLSSDRGKAVAIFVAAIIILASLAFYFSSLPPAEEPIEKATIEDLLTSESARTELKVDMVLTPLSEPFLALTGTPIANYYTSDGSKETVPLLVVGYNEQTQDEGNSMAVINFISEYGRSDALILGQLEEEPSGVEATVTYSDASSKTNSLSTAAGFWSQSDGAVLVKDDKDGYALAVVAVPLASYLNIPVIITDEIDSSVESTLKKLNVKYTLVCGDLKGYKRTWKFEDEEEINSVLATGIEDKSGELKSVLRDRLGLEPRYIAMTNPLDTHQPAVLDSFEEVFTGTVQSQDTGSTSDPSANPDAPKHYITIPEDYQWANVKIDTVMDFTNSPVPGRNPDLDGQRCYTYFGVDEDEDGEIFNDADSENDRFEFFVQSLGYETIRDGGGNAVQAHSYAEEPIYNAQGKHLVQIIATLHLTYSPLTPPPETSYTITVTVDKRECHNYPLMPGLSSLAPYLASYREGIVLAKPEFSIYNEELLEQQYCGDPSENHEQMEICNRHVAENKLELNKLLGDLAGTAVEGPEDYTDLASTYSPDHTNPFYLGIIADTNMVPKMHYPTSGQGELPQEGYGIASDNYYADIDADIENLPFDIDGSDPSLELANGRLSGWDVQDVSALLARSFFYSDIIDNYPGLNGLPWKECAVNTFGTKVPVGSAKTVTEKLDKSFNEARFTVDSHHDAALSDSQITMPIFQRSNFAYFCAHGFYYWFIPPGYKPAGVGGGFYTANVIENDFGPSVIFGSSCVTGKIDGIQPYNAVSQAFLHSGVNAYVGASRLSWGAISTVDSDSSEAYGAYLGLLMYGYLTGYVYNKQGGLISDNIGDLSVGTALMLAKNKYVEDQGTDGGGAHDDTVEEFHCLGDPAFNPYEPNHNG